MELMPAAWKLKEARRLVEQAQTSGGRRPPKGRGRRDLAMLGAGAAGGGATGYVIGHKQSVKKASADDVVNQVRRGARAVTAGADAWQGGTTVSQRRGRMALYGIGGLGVGGAAAGAGSQLVPKKKEKAVAKNLVELSKGFAPRDENSSVCTKISYVKPAHRTTTLNARTGVFEGKTRGVGRRQESRDANSSPKVTTIQARRQDGKYASKDDAVQVFHPKFSAGSRAPRQNTLQVHGKGKDAISRPFAKGLIQTSGASKDFGGRNRVGHRI